MFMAQDKGLIWKEMCNSNFLEKMTNNNTISIFGDGNQTRDWVHVEDIVEAFIKVIKIKHKKNEIIQLGSNNANTVKKLFFLLKKTSLQ